MYGPDALFNKITLQKYVFYIQYGGIEDGDKIILTIWRQTSFICFL